MNDREQVIRERGRPESALIAPAPEEALEKRAQMIALFIKKLEIEGLARNEAIIIAAYQFPH